MTDFMQAWKVSEKNFPRNGSPADKLAFCVNYAILAPSTYNAQPWYFVVDGNTVTVCADRRYALPVIDPDDRQLNMFCAAALFNLRTAIRYFGYEETTELLPDPEDQNVLARVKLGDKLETKPEDGTDLLFKAITKRHTNRGSFADKKVPEELLRKLQSAASSEGAWFHVCTAPERNIIVRMVAEADHIQAGNKNFRRELASWIDERRQLSGDGMPNYGLSYGDVMGSLSPSLVRRFASDNNQTVTDQQLEANSPVLAILGVQAGGEIERLRAGQAFMKVLLQAEAEGLAVSTLNQPCEVPELRLVMHDEIGQQGRAQMILRIGYGGKPSYTPRRPLEAVLDVQGRGKSPAKVKKVANDPQKGIFGRVKGMFRK